MLTDAPDVDGSVWASLTAIAKARGVSKQAISAQLGRLVDAGSINKDRDTRREGREVQVRLAAWLAATNQSVDPAKVLGAESAAVLAGADADQVDAGDDADDVPAPAAAVGAASPAYRKEVTRRASIEADLKQLELEERLGRIRRREEVIAGAEDVAAVLVQEIEALPTFADDLIAAAHAGDVNAVRTMLKRIGKDMRSRLEASLLEFEAGKTQRPDGLAA